jgi:hypothetical protein
MIGSCTICKLCASQAGELNKEGKSRALMLGANQMTAINSAFRATHMYDDSDPGHGLSNPSLLQLIFTILKYPSPSLAHVIAGTTGKHAYARQEVQVQVQHRKSIPYPSYSIPRPILTHPSTHPRRPYTSSAPYRTVLLGFIYSNIPSHSSQPPTTKPPRKGRKRRARTDQNVHHENLRNPPRPHRRRPAPAPGQFHVAAARRRDALTARVETVRVAV